MTGNRNGRAAAAVSRYMRLVLAFAVVSTFACAQDARDLVRRSVEFDQRNWEALPQYGFIERAERKELDGDGGVRKHEIKSWEVTMEEGSPYRRLIAVEDRPLPPEDQQFERDKMVAHLEVRRKETPEDRAKRLEEWERKRRRNREGLEDLPNAFNFRMVGEERIRGRDAYIVEGTARPGYSPKGGVTRYFPNLKLRMWIDKQDTQWAKVEAEVMDTISYGLIVARIAQGSRVIFEQTRINSEVWLPLRFALNASARIALVRTMRGETDISFRDYRKLTGTRAAGTPAAR